MRRAFYIAVGVLAVMILSWLIYQRTFNPSPQQLEQEQELRRALTGPYDQATVRELCEQAFREETSAEARTPSEAEAFLSQPLRQTQRNRWVWQTPVTISQDLIETLEDATEGEWVCVVTDNGDAQVGQVPAERQAPPEETESDETEPEETE